MFVGEEKAEPGGGVKHVISLELLYCHNGLSSTPLEFHLSLSGPIWY